MHCFTTLSIVTLC